VLLYIGNAKIKALWKGKTEMQNSSG